MAQMLAERDSGVRVMRQWLDELQSNITSELAGYIEHDRTAFQDVVTEIVKQEVRGVTELLANNQESHHPRLDSGNHTCLPDRPADCLGYRRQGFITSGVFNIYPVSCCEPVSVWCDMTTGGGGWVVVFARVPQVEQENFARPWNDYKNGFGNPYREFWIGNDILHLMTDNVPSILRVDAENFAGIRKFGEWRSFRVANETDLYNLTIGNYWPSSSLGDDLARNNRKVFTTVDRDNDDDSGNCAEKRTGGGWWYTSCSDCNPTSVMANTDNYLTSATWKSWNKNDPKFTSLRWMQLKIRPKDSQSRARMCIGQ
ncbi:hypothetical protein OTU49_003817 [Cherax quadricarinatus]|uniref:Fibrinogen C-terminal domain-containing protein n=2 Tax=Cherax quadricarinatus TaxID=27406 RepID=A0AAW0XIH5_CHEQU